jgi:undecaprenyl-diphosphatase
MAHFIDWLIQADKNLFVLINSKLTNPILDKVYPWWREGNTWVPLYVFILAFMFFNFGKKTWPWLAFAFLNILISDQVSSTLIKPLFMRLRPCSDPEMQFQIRLLLDHCSGGYSFTSSHATNHFGFAVFITQTVKPYLSNYKWLFFLWAASISYGQVYVGVHYPLDILFGTLLGFVLGFMVSSVYNRRIAIYFPLAL